MERVVIRPFLLARSNVSTRISCPQRPFGRALSTHHLQRSLFRAPRCTVQQNGCCCCTRSQIPSHGGCRLSSPTTLRGQNPRGTIYGHTGSLHARRQYSTVVAASPSEPQQRQQQQQQQTSSAASSPPKALSPPSLDDTYIDTAIVDRAPELSAEQRFLVDQVIGKRKSVFFTGSAGTGKSVLLRQLIQELKEHFKPGQVAVTASTGIAACNIGGCTLHSFAGVGLGTGDVQLLLKKLASNKKATSRWKKVKVLIIDEVSMVDGDLFDKLEEIARKVRKKDLPFGGIQLVITGDFFQLPPVAGATVTSDGLSPSTTSSTSLRPRLQGSMSTTTVIRPNQQVGMVDPDLDLLNVNEEPSSPLDAQAAANAEASQRLMCFDAKTWTQCIPNTLQLTEVFRQQDPVFINMLTEMRHGRLSDATCQMFQQLERTPSYPDDGIKATELFALRRQVDQANERHLADLPGPMYVYESQDEGPLKQYMERSWISATELKLKEYAQVMLIKNLTPTLVNGSMGLVVGFQEDVGYDKNTGQWNKSNFPVVRFQGETFDIIIRPEEWKVEMPNGDIVASRVQVPLILAWAMSIHKSQGQTMSRLKVDMGKIFESGQAYVALSRATSLEGLQVLNFNKRSVQAHERVAQFYSRLNTVSELMELEAAAKALKGKRKGSMRKKKTDTATAADVGATTRSRGMSKTIPIP